LEGVSATLVLVQIGLFVAVQLQGRTIDITDFQYRMLVLAVTGLIAGALVTERRHAEERLRVNREALAHVARVGSMGELAAAIAHEINQPLSAAGTYTGLVAETLETVPAYDASVLKLARNAATQIERAAEVVKRLRTLVRLGRSELVRTDAAAIVHDALDVVQAEFQQKSIVLKVDIASGLPNIMADRLQVQQVLLNLIRNSIEAMESAGHGRGQIAITVRRETSGCVEFSVADTGPGFPPDFDIEDLVLLRTAKPDGLGFGLSLCRTIATSHRGHMRIRGAGSGGACVILSIPAAEGAVHG
jgi:C4-dicarboxylate-specific signal transduction histidine kinase